MLIKNLMGVIYAPRSTWRSIEAQHYTSKQIYLKQLVFMALIAPISFFIGTTQLGWSIDGYSYVKLTTDAALIASMGLYFAIMTGLSLVALAIKWMEKTYGGKAPLNSCLALTVFTATPMLLSGIAALYPMIWLNVFVGMMAVSYSVYLLYMGVPEIMHIPESRAFMFSTSIVTVALCVLVGVMATSVLIWSEIAHIAFVSN